MLCPYRKRYLNPKFVEASRHSQRPRGIQATLAGWSQVSNFSQLLHSQKPVTVTPLKQRRLERLADILDFPAGEIWLPEPDAQEPAPSRLEAVDGAGLGPTYTRLFERVQSLGHPTLAEVCDGLPEDTAFHVAVMVKLGKLRWVGER
jgi:hypothetical protein